MLKASDGALWDAYDVAMLDLDGVVYIGPDAVPGAPEHLAAAREAGMHLAFVTNNASRTPGTVAAHLRELGVEVDDADVVTSAQAAARLLADRLPEGSAVFVIGGEGLEVALSEPASGRSGPEDDPAAVVSGFHAGLRWSHRDRRGDPGARRAAVGGLQHRPDRADPVGPGAGQRRAGRGGRAVHRPSAGGGRQAGAAAVRGDPAPGRRGAAAGGGGPAGHRHRGRQPDRLRQPAGDDRRDRPRRARGRRGAELRPTYVAADLGGLARSPAGAATGRRRTSSSAAGPRGSTDGRLEVDGDGRRRRLVAGVAAAAWRHLDATGEPRRRRRTASAE